MSIQPPSKYGMCAHQLSSFVTEERIKQLADRLDDANYKNSQLQENIEYLSKQLNDKDLSCRNSK